MNDKNTEKTGCEKYEAVTAQPFSYCAYVCVLYINKGFREAKNS